MKKTEREYGSNFRDFRVIAADEKEKNIIKKLGDLPIHGKIGHFDVSDLLWAFDIVSLYPLTMCDEKSKYRKIETGYVFTVDINDKLVEKFSTQSLTNGSALLKVLFYNPKKY